MVLPVVFSLHDMKLIDTAVTIYNAAKRWRGTEYSHFPLGAPGTCNKCWRISSKFRPATCRHGKVANGFQWRHAVTKLIIHNPNLHCVGGEKRAIVINIIE